MQQLKVETILERVLIEDWRNYKQLLKKKYGFEDIIKLAVKINDTTLLENIINDLPPSKFVRFLFSSEDIQIYLAKYRKVDLNIIQFISMHLDFELYKNLNGVVVYTLRSLKEYSLIDVYTIILKLDALHDLNLLEELDLSTHINSIKLLRDTNKLSIKLITMKVLKGLYYVVNREFKALLDIIGYCEIEQALGLLDCPCYTEVVNIIDRLQTINPIELPKFIISTTDINEDTFNTIYDNYNLMFIGNQMYKKALDNLTIEEIEYIIERNHKILNTLPSKYIIKLLMHNEMIGYKYPFILNKVNQMNIVNIISHNIGLIKFFNEPDKIIEHLGLHDYTEILIRLPEYKFVDKLSKNTLNALLNYICKSIPDMTFKEVSPILKELLNRNELDTVLYALHDKGDFFKDTPPYTLDKDGSYSILKENLADISNAELHYKICSDGYYKLWKNGLLENDEEYSILLHKVFPEKKKQENLIELIPNNL